MFSTTTKSCERETMNCFAITEETLTSDVQHIVYDSDLRKITQRSVFQRLQDKYGILLTQFKPFIYQLAVEEARRRIQSSAELQKQQEMLNPKYYYRTPNCINYQDVKNHYIGSKHANDTYSSLSSSDDDRISNTQSKRERQKDIVYEFSDEFKRMMNRDRGSWRQCWEWIVQYADSNNLRIGNRKIRCDYVLKNVFKRDESSVSGVSRLIWNHLIGAMSGKIIKKRKKSGLTRLCFMSKELQDIVGDSLPLPRNEITKAFWDYLELNGLKKGRIVLCNEKLKKIWGQNTQEIHMYSIQKGLKQHITTMTKDEENKYKQENAHLFKNDNKCNL